MIKKMNESLFISPSDQPVLVIGLCGVARSGKDTMCKFLIEEFEKAGLCAKKYALAEELKNEMSHFIFDKFGINVHTCEKEEKTTTQRTIKPITMRSCQEL